MLQALEVGKQFPIANPFGKNDPKGLNDYITAAFVGESFDVYCWVTGVSSKEVQAWRRGWLRYGAFVREDIPFFLLYFPDIKWPLDVSLNALVEKEKGRPIEQYLGSAANMVNMFLIDADSNILKGHRMIGLDNSVAGAIRMACINQVTRYHNSGELLMYLDAIVSTITTQQMITATEMRELPRR